MENIFDIEGVRYMKSHHGHIQQMNVKPFKYNEQYNSTYDTESYRAASKRLNEIRYKLIEMIGIKPKRLLDFGYGNGSFLDYVSERIDNCFGYDVASGYESSKWEVVTNPYGPYDVVCFWDSLEHVERLEFLSRLNTKYIAISLPYAHISKWNVEDFKTWKHRKPDEHIHHFNKSSLVSLMEHYGYKLVCFNTKEDEVRKPARRESNILSCLFIKK